MKKDFESYVIHTKDVQTGKYTEMPFDDKHLLVDNLDDIANLLGYECYFTGISGYYFTFRDVDLKMTYKYNEVYFKPLMGVKDTEGLFKGIVEAIRDKITESNEQGESNSRIYILPTMFPDSMVIEFYTKIDEDE